MSNETQSVKTGWSSVRGYAISVICLLVGVYVGYLFRGSTAPRATAPAAAQGQMTAGSPVSAAPVQPTPEQLKQMAVKQVAPLLDQLKNNPEDPDTLDKVAQQYFVARQFKDAAIYLEKLVAVKPTPAAWINLSRAYFYSGAADKAIDGLNEALKLDPKSADALFGLGMLKWQVKGDTKGAIECWEKQLKTDQNPQRRGQVEQMIARAKMQGSKPSM
jgi:cytochrome c-type biogenesis protein CcmH/NrfG